VGLITIAMKINAKVSLFFFLILISFIAHSQAFEISKTNSAAVKGTSSLHDWVMDLKVIQSGFMLVREGNNVKGVDNISFSCKARDLKSESSIMDKKAYDALKAKEFPDITFKGTSVTGFVSSGKKFSGKLIGNLSLAGVTHEITVPFTGSFSDSKTVNIESSAELTFRGFGMNPPTAMLGTLKTGDKVTILFNLQYVQK